MSAFETLISTSEVLMSRARGFQSSARRAQLTRESGVAAESVGVGSGCRLPPGSGTARLSALTVQRPQHGLGPNPAGTAPRAARCWWCSCSGTRDSPKLGTHQAAPGRWSPGVGVGGGATPRQAGKLLLPASHVPRDAAAAGNRGRGPRGCGPAVLSATRRGYPCPARGLAHPHATAADQRAQ